MLAEGIHTAALTGNDPRANFVLFDVEDITVWLPGVGDGVRLTGLGEGGEDDAL